MISAQSAQITDTCILLRLQPHKLQKCLLLYITAYNFAVTVASYRVSRTDVESVIYP